MTDEKKVAFIAHVDHGKASLASLAALALGTKQQLEETANAVNPTPLPKAKKHKPDCKFLRAATCAVGIECEHGYDVCPICDPCTCEE